MQLIWTIGNINDDDDWWCSKTGIASTSSWNIIDIIYKNIERQTMENKKNGRRGKNWVDFLSRDFSFLLQYFYQTHTWDHNNSQIATCRDRQPYTTETVQRDDDDDDMCAILFILLWYLLSREMIIMILNGEKHFKKIRIEIFIHVRSEYELCKNTCNYKHTRHVESFNCLPIVSHCVPIFF